MLQTLGRLTICLNYLCFLSKNLEVSTIESVMQATRTKVKSDADCSEQCLSSASELTMKEKRSRRSYHNPATIENCLLCQKKKAVRKDGRISVYESLAEL